MPIRNQKLSSNTKVKLPMKTKKLTFLLALTFLFLFSGSVFGQEEVNGGDETVRSYSKSGKLVTEY